MKRVMNVQRLVLNVSMLFMLLLIPYFGKAHPNGVGWISNCYQKIYFGSNGIHENKKLLHFGGKPVFSFGSTSGTDLRYFTARPYDPVSGVIGPYIDFPGRVLVPGYDAAGNPVDIYENDQPMVSLPEVPSVIIDFYSPSRMYSLSLTIDFIGVNEAFKIQPVFQSCFTYENFQFKNNVVQLEGFCGEITGKIVLPGGVPDRMGLPEPFSMDIVMPNQRSEAPASEAVNIPIDRSRCSSPNPSTWCEMSAPCGCITFNFEFKLKPCPNSTMACASEEYFTQPINICCRCGSTSGGPGSGTNPIGGRKTDNAALSGQTSDLSIFPNPNNTGKLEINAPNGPVRNIKIYAVDGRQVKEVRVPEQNKVSVDISGLKPGMYQVKVTDISNAVSTKKLIVQ
ncbi:MAG TPA: T9SS type A sorting domain-containing protein [Chitinophagaceae bacterium]|nr:T9SS type A sorting domain-containing protein [Chitinophagaceae bacterium]